MKQLIGFPRHRQSLIDPGWATVLFLSGLFSRLPFRSQILHHWDSVNFALGMQDYDVYLHQPHPPGYFLYVMWGRLVNSLINDANASLVWISVLASGLAMVAVFFLAQALWGRKSGIVASLLLMSSPLFWFHGEVALSYMIEAVLVTLVAFQCYRHLIGKDDRVWLSALLLGLAGGFRQNTMVFLLPLWLTIIWRFRWRKAIWALIVLASTCAVWLLPMMILTGGATRYWEAVGAAGQLIAQESSFSDLKQLAVNGIRLLVYVIYAILLGVIPLILGIWQWGRESLRNWRLILREPRVHLFFWWISPSLGFYLLIHIRQQGHSFTFMPAVLLLTAASIAKISSLVRNQWHRAVYSGIIAIVILSNTLFFLAAPSALFGSSQMLFSTPSWASIWQYDTDVRNRILAIRDTFPPNETIVLAGSRDFRLPDYYLSDYQLPGLSHELGAEPVILPDHVHTLVLFDDTVFPQYTTEEPTVNSLQIPGERCLRFISWNQENQAELSLGGLKVE